MSIEERVFIAGAGPVGLVAAACLVRQAIPVTVFEASPDLNMESRASTFHPPTLDMLDGLGVASALIGEGLIAPTLQYRSRQDGLIAQFDFGMISDLTSHPYRLQCEQFKLTRIIREAYSQNSNFRIEFGSRVQHVEQTDNFVRLSIARKDGSRDEQAGRWLIGADGARSAVRRALNVNFEGFTWPERFLVISTSFNFLDLYPDLAPVSYVADPKQWHFLLRVPGMWRAMFPIAPDISDDLASSKEFAKTTLESIIPDRKGSPILHTTLYRVHQRVAETFRKGRVFLAGDAAHINNPLGGMGMNGGIHDAINLCERLGAVIGGDKDETELDRFDRQRRLVTTEYVQRQTIENKQNLEAADSERRAQFRDTMRSVSSDPAKAREHLLKISMISSLRRAAELG